MSVDKCLVCQKVAYQQEKLVADGRVFHKSCFRCKTCNSVLKLGSYASMENETFCKPCFKKAFFSTGNYSTGFGKLKPQQEFEQKKGRGAGGDSTDAQPSESASEEPASLSASASESTAEPTLEKSASEQQISTEPETASAAEPDSSEPEKAAEPETAAEPDKTAEPEAAAESDKTAEPEAAEAASAPVLEKSASQPAAESAAESKPAPTTPARTSVRDLANAANAVSPGKTSCLACGKAVYALEKLEADGRVYHKSCFRCKHCNCILKLGSFASMENESFCKPCFKKAFFSTGNYSTGFGKLKPQQEFEQKKGRGLGASEGSGAATEENEGDGATAASEAVTTN